MRQEFGLLFSGGSGVCVCSLLVSLSDGITLFVQQYDRSICCELLLATLHKYLGPVCTWYVVSSVWSAHNTKKVKCLFLHKGAHKIPHVRGSSKMESQTEGAKRVHF